MVTGVVSSWNGERGWGFVKRDDGKDDCFLHVKFCERGFIPKAGDQVEFEVVADERNPRRGRADHVRLVFKQQDDVGIPGDGMGGYERS